jgi:hypothetical protein
MPHVSRNVWVAAAAVAAPLLVIGTWLLLGTERRPAAEPRGVVEFSKRVDREASTEEVAAFCGACHAVPEPALFPRYAWSDEVTRGYAFYRESGMQLKPPPPAEVLRYYMNRAPMELSAAERLPSGEAGRFAFERRTFGGDGVEPPMVSHVRFAELERGGGLQVVACDMAGGRVVAWRPEEPGAGLRVLGKGMENPAHFEVTDLNQDGVKDLLAACLGERGPSEATRGRVVWLRGRADGTFEAVGLVEGLGRVADAQAADFDGDGDLDIVVAVFGFQVVGQILLLENRTTDWERPEFSRVVLDERDGTIAVPVTDLNGDGRPDFIALLSQEHEVVEAYLNQGSGSFERKTIFRAPHPAFGSSGMQLVDFDGDGDQDVLLSNGDVLDKKIIVPYQGIQWLENGGEYPFVAHRIDWMPGVARAVAGDIDGDGDLDILATSFLPGGHFSMVRRGDGDAISILEQTEAGVFRRHSIQVGGQDYASADIADFDRDGQMDLVTATCLFTDPVENPAPAGREWVVIDKGSGDPGWNERTAAPKDRDRGGQ